MNIEVIRMHQQHTEKIAAIESLCFAHPRSQNSLIEELSNNNAVFFSAISGDNVIGYGGMNTVLDEAYIADIAVHPDYRRIGVGRMILTALIDYCKKKGMSFLTLEVRQSNTPAITMYKQFGFCYVGTRKNFYTSPTEDADLMTLYFENPERK